MTKKYNNDFKFISEFLNCDGISGYETEISEKYKSIAKKAGAKITRGGLGSVIAKIGTKGPKVMIAAHMDEVGFVVARIEKDGFIRISPLGGSWPHIVLGLPVKVLTTKGKVYHGTIGSTSIHVVPQKDVNKVIPFKDLYVDLGFDSREEVEKVGIDIGDQIIRESTTKLIGNGDKFMAKAADNRYGVAIMARVLEKLKTAKLPCQVYMVASSQEEVGLRGAKASVKQVNPDIAIALDTTVSHDTPGILAGNTKLGGGVSVTMKDGGTIPNPKFANMMVDLAKSKKIDVYKTVSVGGGNDAEELQYGGTGIPTISLGIPTRYLHTINEIGSFKDYNDYIDLLVEFLKTFTPAKYKSLLYK